MLRHIASSIGQEDLSLPCNVSYTSSSIDDEIAYELRS